MMKEKPCDNMEKDHFTVGWEIIRTIVQNHMEAPQNFLNKTVLYLIH